MPLRRRRPSRRPRSGWRARGRRPPECRPAGRGRGSSRASRSPCAARSRPRASRRSRRGAHVRRRRCRFPCGSAACPRAGSRPRRPPRSRSCARARGGGADGRRPARCRTGARARGSRRRRRRGRRGWRSSRHGGPSPRRPSRGRATRRSCAGGRSRRSRSARRSGSRTSHRYRRGRCRSSSGTPDDGMPCSCRRSATPSVSSPPIGISASTPRASSVRLTTAAPSAPSAKGFVREVPRIVPPRGRIPAVLSSVSSTALSASTPRPAVAEAEEGVPGSAQAAPHDRADHRVEPGAVAAAGEHRDPRHQHILLYALSGQELVAERRQAGVGVVHEQPMRVHPRRRTPPTLRGPASRRARPRCSAGSPAASA